MKEDIFLSVVIPAYNETEGIAGTLADISGYLFNQNYSSEIIVVNDGSKDDTSDVVRKIQGTIHNLRLIDNKKNKGKGGAVKQGMLAAIGKYRLYADADNAISIVHLEKFWPYIKEGYDVVIGSIEIEGAVKKQRYPGYRKILGKLSKYVIRFLTLWSIHDTQRAFKLFPAEVTEKIFSQQTIMRWGFDIEILVIANRMGYKIKEVPVTWINPSVGRVTFMSYIYTFIELLTIKLNLLRGKYKKQYEYESARS